MRNHLHPAAKAIIVLIAAVGIMNTPVQAGEPGSDQHPSPLHRAAQLWIDSFEAGDLDGLMTLYTNDVTVALHGQPVLNGIDEVRAYFAARLGKWDSRFELEIERVEMGAQRSWLMSKYWFVARDLAGDGGFRDAGRSLLIYEPGDDGQWLIAADIDQATPDVTWPSPQGLE